MSGRRGRGDGSVRPRRRADGSCSYEVRVYIHGKRISFYDDTKTGAKAKAHEALVDATRGVVAPPKSITAAQYLEQWLRDVARPSVRASTYRSYEMHVREHLAPALGEVKLVDLAPGHVRRVLSDLVRRKGLTETSAQRVRATLSSALKAGMVDYNLPRNVASQVRVPKGDRPRFVPEQITPALAREILAALEGSRVWPVALFAMATGVRQGELLAIRWLDINLPRRTLTITHAVGMGHDGQSEVLRPKSRESQRVIPLSRLAIRALWLRKCQCVEDKLVAGDAWQGGEFVFSNQVGALRTGSALTHRLQDRLRRRGIEPVRWHALRRVFAVLLDSEGVSITQIQRLLGHADIKTTLGYLNPVDRPLRAAARAIDRYRLAAGPQN